MLGSTAPIAPICWSNAAFANESEAKLSSPRPFLITRKVRMIIIKTPAPIPPSMTTVLPLSLESFALSSSSLDSPPLSPSPLLSVPPLSPPPLLSTTSHPSCGSTVTFAPVSGQSSAESTTPSPSESTSHPSSGLKVNPVGVSGQSSSES